MPTSGFFANAIAAYSVPAEVGMGFVESAEVMEAWKEVDKPTGQCTNCLNTWLYWPRAHCRRCGNKLSYEN